jgi:hypothetical protein
MAITVATSSSLGPGSTVRQKVVGLVDDHPVGAAHPGAQLLQVEHQRFEVGGPIGQRDAQQVHRGVLVGRGQNLHHLGDRGRVLGVPQRGNVGQVGEVPLGIDDAELVALLGELLDETAGQGALSAA